MTWDQVHEEDCLHKAFGLEDRGRCQRADRLHQSGKNSKDGGGAAQPRWASFPRTQAVHWNGCVGLSLTMALGL